MWKNIIIVILTVLVIVFAVLFFLCNRKIKDHMKQKEEDLNKREEVLIIKEKCNEDLIKLQEKINQIKKLLA